MGSAGKVNIDENFWNLVFMIYWSNCNTKKKFSLNKQVFNFYGAPATP